MVIEILIFFLYLLKLIPLNNSQLSNHSIYYILKITITVYKLKLRYFYIIPRQEETRFHSFKNQELTLPISSKPLPESRGVVNSLQRTILELFNSNKAITSTSPHSPFLFST